MELIDRDKLIEILAEMQGRCATKAALVQNSKIWQQVKDMPTVEAIPVEYIESTMNRWKEIIGYEESVDALRILIDNWKIERKEE